MMPEGMRIPFLQEDPEYDHPPHVPIEEVWATAHNTLIEIYPWILPLFCAGAPDVFRFRVSISRWAEFVHKRYGPSGMREKLSQGYVDHPYHAVALNRKTRDKPLTLEIRLNEAHPCIAYMAICIMNRIIRKCYERGYLSPKLALMEGDRARLYRDYIKEAVMTSATRNRDLYDTLEEYVQRWVQDYGPIPFEREIPRLKKHYDSYFELFRDIMRHYMFFTNPIEYRVWMLFSHKGNPRKNWRRVWYLFHAPKGEFYWEDPYITGL